MPGRVEDGGRQRRTLIACEVFRSALHKLGIDRPKRSARITYLPPHLHLHPERLRQQLLQRLEAGGPAGSYAGCLYGQCFPNIDNVLRPWRIERIACGHCYEILLGRKIYADLMREHPGSFFLEKAFIEDFDNLCRAPLELDDPQMREWYFEHYRQVVYIRQPMDPDLMKAVQAIAALLNLDVKVRDADYTDLISYLDKQDIL